jgi:hypothetical protein
MSLFQNLFSDTVGLLSVFTIAFILGMAVYLYVMVSKKMNDKSK